MKRELPVDEFLEDHLRPFTIFFKGNGFVCRGKKFVRLSSFLARRRSVL